MSTTYRTRNGSYTEGGRGRRGAAGAYSPDRSEDRVSTDQERPGSAERAANRGDEIDWVVAGQARDWRELRGAQRAERHRLGVRQREEVADAAEAARDWLARSGRPIPPARGAHALWLHVTFRYGQHERMRQERYQERALAADEPETAEAIRQRRTEYELGERQLPAEREQVGGGRTDDEAGRGGAGETARRDEAERDGRPDEREDAAPEAEHAEEIRTRAEPGRAARDEKARDAGKQTGEEREKGRGLDPDAAERRAREQRQQERRRDRGGRELE